MTESPESRPTRRRITWAGALITSGWLWGLALTYAFYLGLPHLPGDQTQWQRYFTAHWIEYATTGLFFIGMATLVIKLSGVPAERQALTIGLLEGLDLTSGTSATVTADRIAAHLKLVARRQEHSWLVRRIRDVCDYVRGRRATDGLEAQLSYLADSAATRMHDSYALIRTITWAIPILGFLGTVIGITMSIANITPDQLESSLGEVTAGLAVAFDTTALSLALSMVLVFTTFVVERQEQQILDAIEDFSMQSLVPLFPSQGAAPVAQPLIDAERAAAEQLLAKTEALVNWQMTAWQESLEQVRQRWSTTLEQQQTALDRALQSGLTTALADHAEQLETTRNDFIAAFGLATQAIRDQLTVTQELLHQQHVANLRETQATWREAQTSLQEQAAQQQSSWREWSTAWSGEVHGWQEQLRDATAAIHGQLAELRQQGGTLLRIVEQEEQLVRLEDKLNQNLETVRMVDTLDETLVSLNAAVNLLSAKTRAKAA